MALLLGRCKTIVSVAHLEARSRVKYVLSNCSVSFFLIVLCRFDFVDDGLTCLVARSSSHFSASIAMLSCESVLSQALISLWVLKVEGVGEMALR